MAKVLAAYALVNEAEMKTHLSIDIEDHDRDGLIRDCINECSLWFEQKTSRRLRYRGYTNTEYHSFKDYRAFFYALEYPVIAAVGLWESPVRAFTDSWKLTEGTDYVLDKPFGKVTRISSGTSWPTNFDVGVEHVKFQYTCGFDGIDGVPSDWKLHLKRCAARLFRELDRGEQGRSSISDNLGNISRFSDNIAPKETLLFLAEQERHGYPTGRDATEAVTFGSVTGTVTLAATPVEGAIVSVSHASLSGYLTTTTDANGLYLFSGSVPVGGTYTVQASKVGSGVGSDTGTVASEGATTDTDIALA